MRRLLLLLVALTTPTLASAAGGAPTWVFAVARFCIAQDPAYRRTMLGDFVMKGRLNFDSNAFDECAGKHKWVAKSFCDEVMALKSESDLSADNIERLRKKHEPELLGFERAGNYFNAFAQADAGNKPPPACPSDK